MKYFTKDLLDKFNDQISEDETQNYDKIWAYNLHQYWDEFYKISDRLPKRFVKLFKGGQLHDSIVENISINQSISIRKKYYDVVVRLKSDTFYCDLIHNRINSFMTSFDNLYVQNGFDYLYGEILQEPNGLWTHEFLLSCGSEVKIKCKEIKWSPVKG